MLGVSVSSVQVSRDTRTPDTWHLKWAYSSMAEQSAHNALVAGSNPAGPTENKAFLPIEDPDEKVWVFRF